MLIILTGCATKLKLSAKKQKGQKLEYKNGNWELTSMKKKSGVVLSCEPKIIETSQRIRCFISLFHDYKKFNFSDENISVKVADETVKVLSYDEMVAEIESERSAAQWATALNATSAQLNADQNAYTTTTHQGSINGRYGNNYNYSGTSTTYDANKAQQIKRQAQADMNNSFDRSNQVATAKYQSLQYYIRMTTIPKRKWYSGMFYIEKLFSLETTSLVVDKTPIRVVVNINNEKHSFQINKQVHSAN